MTDPLVRRADEVQYDPVDAAEGMAKGVLVDESDGAPNFALRRFTLDPGASVLRHTNAVEHEQYVLTGEYVLAGEYVVGIGDEAFTVDHGGDVVRIHPHRPVATDRSDRTGENTASTGTYIHPPTREQR